MALMTAVTPAVLGTVASPDPVAASDTINGNLAEQGAVLIVSNGSASPINVTFTDPGKTPAGNTGTQAPVAVAAGATKYFRLSSVFVNPATGLITVAYSDQTDVTSELLVVS